MIRLPASAREQAYYSSGFTISVNRPSGLTGASGIGVVTCMIKLIKLTWEFNYHLSRTLVRSRHCKQTGYSKLCPFSDDYGVKNLTKFYQSLPKTYTERARTWQITADNGGFSRPTLLKRVKSGRLVSSCHWWTAPLLQKVKAEGVKSFRLLCVKREI